MSTNLPSVHRFYSEDMKAAPPWFHEFLKTLNLFTEPIYNILNQQVEPTQNTTEEIYTFTLTAAATSTSASYSNANQNRYSFAPKKFIGIPRGVVLCQCLPLTANVAYVGNPVTFDWYFNKGQVEILGIYGLTSGIKYQITVRIF